MNLDERDSTSRGTAGRDVFRGTADDDMYAGRGGNDLIRGKGGDDDLKGNGGRDVIRGGGGEDELNGGGGKDRLAGGGGEDDLCGGKGRDTLDGGGGGDDATGGAGADEFVLGPNGGFDRLIDFSLADGDQIRLDGLLEQAPPGSDLVDLLRLEQTGQGTVLAVAPAGDGAFQDLALLQDQALDLTQLIDAGAIIGLPGAADEPAKARRDEAGTSEDAPLELAGLLANDSGAALEIVAIDDSATEGEVTLRPDGTVRYDPSGRFDGLAEGASAKDRFDYTIEDGLGRTDSARVVITVEGGNDAPDATSPGTQTAREAGPPLNLDLAEVFTDPDDGAALTYEATRANGARLPNWLSLDGDVVTGQPGPFDRADLSVRVTATDEHGASDSTTFTVQTEGRQAPNQPQQSARAPNFDGSTDSTFPDASDTGRFVVFAFDEPNPDSDEFSEIRSIRLKDFATDETYVLFDAGNDVDVSGPSVTADGRTVAFYSEAGGASVRVLTTQDLDPVTVVTAYERGVAAEFTAVSLSADGTVVAFSDGADLVVANVATGAEDTITGASYPSLSADGSRVAFNQPDGSGGFEVAVATIDTDTMRASERTPLAEATGFTAPSISGSGQLIAFQSAADDLVAGDINERGDVFVYDLSAGGSPIRIVSVDADGDQGSGPARRPSISSDGDRIAFVGSTDTDDPLQILVKELAGDEALRLVSVNLAGDAGNDDSSDPSISSDGSFVTYTSGATNLTPDAADNAGQAVFLTPVDAPFTQEVDYPAPDPTPPTGPGDFVGNVAINPDILDSLVGNPELTIV